MKPVRSFRISQELLDKAKKAGFNVTEIIEAALANALKDNRCPYCGKEMKRQKFKEGG